jgi:hypothetical protein
LCSFPILQSIDVKQTGWISMGSGATMPINTETPEVPGSKIGMRVVSFLGPKMFDPQTRSWKSARAGDPGIHIIYIYTHIQLYICIRIIWWYYIFFLAINRKERSIGSRRSFRFAPEVSWRQTHQWGSQTSYQTWCRMDWPPVPIIRHGMGNVRKNLWVQLGISWGI